MSIKFKTIGVMGKYNNPEVHSTFTSLVNYLNSQDITVITEISDSPWMADIDAKQVTQEVLGSLCDAVIVVGGDGSFLSAARAMVDMDVPLVGVNRGQRGFLTDISPQALTQSIEPIIKGQYREERRFLLEMELWRDKEKIYSSSALNDVVLYCGDIAKMIDFEVRVQQEILYRQRSDGIITATPTGSTAYALAGGGPILHPSLNAIALVPMHPPMLSSRPIVVDSFAKIELHVVPENTINPRLSCDGQIHFDAQPDDRIIIRRKAKELRILHQTDYDYYYTLRSKLKWTT